MNLSLSEHLTDLEKSLAVFEYLASAELQVGLPASASGRSRFVLGIQEHGAPVMHIPARPVIEPALSQDSVVEAMAEAGAQAVLAAVDGDLSGAKAALEQAGQAGADGIRAYIDSGISPGNSPKTISGGWIWNRVARKGVLIPGKGFDKPLYDTGELYGSFGYEIL